MKTEIGIGILLACIVGCSTSGDGVERSTTHVTEVTALSVLAEDGQVVLRWSEHEAASNLDHVEIATVGSDQLVAVPAGVGTTLIKGLQNRTPYTFLVKTVDKSGNRSRGVAIGARADFVRIEGGTFRQGTDDATTKDSFPAHFVTLSSYYLGKYEVTFAEYDEFADLTGRPLASDRGWGRGARPAQSMNWFSAVAYANWRSEREGLQPVYTIDESTPDPLNVSGEAINYLVTANWEANGYRLPTEAEWEFAARGAGATHGYLFSGSDSILDVAWSGADLAAGLNGAACSHSVGTKQANELGLYDMTGNVVEFTWDPALYAKRNNYTSEAQTDPHGPAGDYDRRVVRGGGPHASAGCSFSVTRKFQSPTRECMLGIRLARRLDLDTPQGGVE